MVRCLPDSSASSNCAGRKGRSVFRPQAVIPVEFCYVPLRKITLRVTSKMIIRTAVLTDFDSYLDSEYPSASSNLLEGRESEIQDRKRRLEAFSYAVVLQVAFAEMDYANRWCWKQFGPPEGECFDRRDSEYPTCDDASPHSHQGKWLCYWLAKTDYNFGYYEWCFALQTDRDSFLAFVPQIQWGEAFPKTPSFPK